MTEQKNDEIVPTGIDEEIKELERDTQAEELRQLRAKAKTQWVTPAVFAALLPILGGFGVWAMGEFKQYNKGYQALAERDAFRKEKESLQKQKDSLNIEVTTLLQLKEHYAADAERLKKATTELQQTIDNTYLRSKFESFNTNYFIDIMGPRGRNTPRSIDIESLRKEIKSLPEATQTSLQHVFKDRKNNLYIIKKIRSDFTYFYKDTRKGPISTWAIELSPDLFGGNPNERKTMTSPTGKKYDLTLQRFLTDKDIDDVKKR